MKNPMKGKITISRYTGGERGTGINIKVVDELSGTEFISVEITAETLGNALTGMGFQPCEFELRAEQVGKKHEHKTEVLPIRLGYYKQKDAEAVAKKALKPYEKDGWTGDWRDLCNHHRWTGADKTTVTFHRFVQP